MTVSRLLAVVVDVVAVVLVGVGVGLRFGVWAALVVVGVWLGVVNFVQGGDDR